MKKKKPKGVEGVRHRTSVRIPVDLKEKIEALAKSDRRSFSSMTSILLEEVIVKHAGC
ncbi:MAG: CopG-like 1 or ribbon-helix-helix domain, 5 [Verrucomicrobiota bacterium]